MFAMELDGGLFTWVILILNKKQYENCITML
jgi:hypothetical protein